MSNRDRIIVFAIGFVLGMILVSTILQRRAQKEKHLEEDPWLSHKAAVVEAGAEPLPKSTPEAILSGKLIDFGYLPNKSNADIKVWHLSFDKSYPYVRVTEDISTGKINYMAADQVVIRLKKGVDVTALKPMLDTLGLRLRMFNRKEQVAIIGVLNTQIDAVPVTIKAVQPYADLFQTVGPDIIEFR